jgi:nitroreductase
MSVLFKRRSIRKFKSDKISEEDVRYIISAAMAAPTAGGQRPWKFIIIDKRELLDLIPSFHPYSKSTKEAPLAILVCADKKLDKLGGYWVQDCAASTQNILLAACERGLGSLWLGVYPKEDRASKAREIFNVPVDVVPFSLVVLGHADENIAPNSGYDEKKVFRNKYGEINQ